MRLSVNIIAGSPSRYFRAGEEVPDGEVPPELAAAYAVAEELIPPPGAEEAAASDALPESELQEAPQGTHVKRGSSWRRIGPDTEITPGEPTYRRIGKAFVPA